MKGIQRKMIVVRTESSQLFEEAHFLLKRGAESGMGTEGDILGEANRIIEESMYPYIKRKTQKSPAKFSFLRCLLLFGAGLLAGGGIIALILLL